MQTSIGVRFVICKISETTLSIEPGLVGSIEAQILEYLAVLMLKMLGVWESHFPKARILNAFYIYQT
jgi:hypothetical protein